MGAAAAHAAGAGAPIAGGRGLCAQVNFGLDLANPKTLTLRTGAFRNAI